MKHLYQLTKEEIKKIFANDPHHAQLLAYEYQRGPFIQISHKLLDNKRYLNEFFYTKKSRVYFFLRRHIIRADDWFFSLIYRRYYMKGLLATGVKMTSLCKKLEMPETTIRDQLKSMEKDGLIIIDRYDASETTDGIPGQVYILGSRKDGIEKYFIDDVYLRNIKPEVPDDDD